MTALIAATPTEIRIWLGQENAVILSPRNRGSVAMSSYRRMPSVVHEQFGDETVMVNLDTGCYYSVQGSGYAIWASVIEGLSRPDIAAHATAKFDGDPAAIRTQTFEFLDRLVEEKLIDSIAQSNGAASSLDAADSTKSTWASPTLQKYTDMEEMLKLDPIHEVDDMGWPKAKETGP